MPEIVLTNCRTEPWSSYMRGFAVLRIVSEQKDQRARGWFQNGRFVLSSEMDRDALLAFFMDEYIPTPIVSPWSGGSGFYQNDDKSALESILSSEDPRFKAYSKIISQIRGWPEIPVADTSLSALMDMVVNETKKLTGVNYEVLINDYGRDPGSLSRNLTSFGLLKNKFPFEDALSAITIQNEMRSEGSWGSVSTMSIERIDRKALPRAAKLIANTKKVRTFIDERTRKECKETFLRRCRSTLPIEALMWMDSVMIINQDGEAEYPPILGGSGGNEGRLEYSRTYMGYLVDLLLSSDKARSRELLANSLFGDRTNKLGINTMGMFDPGRAGGFNQGVGIESKDFPANPWDFVLSIEGSILWASSITRRNGDSSGSLASPFATRAKGVGYASASEEDGGSSTREIWAPVWGNPATLRETRYLMAEGRAYLGRKVTQQSVQFAVALANLGVDRGLTEFIRYGMLVRRGDSKVMMPLGRFRVSQIPQAHLLEELDRILARVDASIGAMNGEVPSSLSSARRKVDNAIFNVVSYGSPSSYKDLLRSVGQLEKALKRGGADRKHRMNQPLKGLSLEWLMACDDGTPEVRIAGALSSIYDKELGPWRAHLVPLDPKRPYAWAQGSGYMVWSNADIYRNLAAALHKRILLASTMDDSHPLHASICIHPSDAMALVRGPLDERALEDLLWGMTWIDWTPNRASIESIEKVRNLWSKPLVNAPIPRGWSLLAATLSPDGIDDGEGGRVDTRPETRSITLLMADRYNEAVRTAQRRLFANGIPLRDVMPEEELEGIRVAASLSVPVKLHEIVYDILVKKSRGE